MATVGVIVISATIITTTQAMTHGVTSSTPARVVLMTSSTGARRITALTDWQWLVRRPTPLNCCYGVGLVAQVRAATANLNRTARSGRTNSIAPPTVVQPDFAAIRPVRRSSATFMTPRSRLDGRLLQSPRGPTRKPVPRRDGVVA